MVKFNFRNKFLSILAAMTILVGATPVMADNGTGISITTTKTNWDSGYAFTNADGGGFLVMQMTEEQIRGESKPWVAYSIYVEKAGKYTIEFKSSPLTDGRYTSPATFSVNAVAAETALKSSIDVNTKIYTSVVNLNEGENELRFTIVGSRPNTGTDGLFHLYYVNCEEYRFSGIRYEGESGAATVSVGWQKESAFRHNQTNNIDAIRAGNEYWEQSFNAPAGKYKLTWRTTDIAGTQYVSPAKLTVNGEEVIAKTKTSDGDPWFIQSNEVYLTEGINKVRFTITNTKNFGAGPQALLYIDYIELEQLEGEDAESEIYYDALKFEGEDATGSVERISGEDADGFSGEAWNRVRGTATTTFTTPADDFDLYITVGADIDVAQHENGKYLGTAAISIDGGEFIPLSGTNMTKIAGLTGTAGGCANTAKWQYKPVVTLEEGQHSFAIKYVGVGSNGNAGNTFIYYDCFELIPRNGIIEKAVIKAPQSKVICGTQMPATSGLYYTTGYMVEEAKILSANYTSSNPLVASVDSDGVITAINPGVAEILVTYNDTYTDSLEIIVCDESGIIPISSSYDEETGVATIKLTRIMDATGNATVIFGAYDEVDGVMTSFQDKQAETDVNPERGRVKTVSKTVIGNNICAFIWDNVGGLKPFADVIELK